MARYLIGRPISLRHTFLEDETALVVASVTVTVTKETAVAPAFTGAAVADGDGWTVALGQLSEGVYTVHWDGVSVTDTETVEVVGGFLFDIPEARASDPDLTADRYSATDIRRYREITEAEFERITGRSFTLRTRAFRLVVDDSGFTVLPVRDVAALVSVTGPDGPVALDDVYVSPEGFLEGLYGDSRGTEVTVILRYGSPSVPEDVKRAGILRMRTLLYSERSGIPDRATSFQAMEGGTYTLATPGRGGSETGIPEVDAVLARYTYRLLNSVSLG